MTGTRHVRLGSHDSTESIVYVDDPWGSGFLDENDPSTVMIELGNNRMTNIHKVIIFKTVPELIEKLEKIQNLMNELETDEDGIGLFLSKLTDSSFFITGEDL